MGKTKCITVPEPVKKHTRVSIEVMPNGGYFVGVMDGSPHYCTPIAAFESFPSLSTWLKKHVVPK